MIGFIRNEGIKTSLGIGEFDPLFKKLKEGLENYIAGRYLWSSQKMEETRTEVKWKHIVDKGGGNCHCIVGSCEERPDPNSLALSKYQLGGIFKSHGCKLIAIETYPGSKPSILKKYGLEEGPKMIVVVKYAKLK